MPSTRRAVCAATVLLAMSGLGCGGADADPEATATAPAGAPTVDLTITIAASSQPDAERHAWRLRCSPVGGDWPARSAACDRLRPEMLAPIGPETRDLVVITPHPVKITGRAFGRKVTLDFPRRGSSTRRYRFRQLRAALGEAAFTTAEKRSG